MAEEVKINVYLVNRVGKDGPKDGSTLFVFDTPDKLPEGVHVDRSGNVAFTAKAPEHVSLKYILQTTQLSWDQKPYKVSLQPTGSQPKEHMLWVTPGTYKPTTSAPAAGFKDYLPVNNGVVDSMSVTIDRTQAKAPVYTYALAVNMSETGKEVTTVRDDPQIKNPPREFAIEWILALGLGLVLSFLGGNFYARWHMRSR